ncbi:MAG TPA: hypothetical protein PLD25_02985 [Chloroflexota bacterium]|nr:hypothetical protein [Chloroflexota bacterium]
MQEQAAENETSLAVVYNNRQAHLTFSDITQIFPPEEALERFVAELMQAVNVIRDLRTIQRHESKPDTTSELNKILLEVITGVETWYGAIRTYATERLESIDSSKNIASLAPEAQAQVQFEAYMWTGIREIGHPLASLFGHCKLITNEQGQQEELLSRFDIITEKLFELLQKIKMGKQTR